MKDYDNYTNIVGIKAEITAADGWNESGLGGGIVFNADNKTGTGWTQFEWGINGDGTDAKNTAGVTIAGSNGKFTITYMGTDTYFKDTDEWDALAVAPWWGSDFTVTSLVGLDKDGNVIGGTTSQETDDTPATTTTTQQAVISPNNNNNNNTKTTGAKTGDAGVGVAVAGLALAGIGIVVTRKKH
jgi:LPXTG-motif cell wall-anchored protein